MSLICELKLFICPNPVYSLIQLLVFFSLDGKNWAKSLKNLYHRPNLQELIKCQTLLPHTKSIKKKRQENKLNSLPRWPSTYWHASHNFENIIDNQSIKLIIYNLQVFTILRQAGFLKIFSLTIKQVL